MHRFRTVPVRRPRPLGRPGDSHAPGRRTALPRWSVRRRPAARREPIDLPVAVGPLSSQPMGGGRTARLPLRFLLVATIALVVSGGGATAQPLRTAIYLEAEAID